MMRRLLFIPVWLLIASGPASAALRAWVDDSQIAPGETFELTLAHDGQTNTQPDLAPLRQDFDIVSRNSSSNLQIINGSTSSSTQLTLTLAPKRAGHLTIPALTWDGDQSAPLAVNVSASGGNAGSAGAATGRVFLQTEVDPKSPFVQAAVHVTVSVYSAVPLSHADLEFPATDAALVREAGPDTTSTAQRNGESYQVVTRHYLLFPQHSGHLSIPGPTLSGNVPAKRSSNDPFAQFFGNDPLAGVFRATKPIRLNGNAIELDVQPRPAGAGASYWIPARDVQLTGDWNPRQLQAHSGDPVTVTLHLQAQDLTAAQLPDLSTLLALPDGLKAYPDEPQLKDMPSGDSVLGKRDQSIALIADQPGSFTIPELRLSWWDTRANQPRQVTLPARTLVVTPSPGSQSAAPRQATTGSARPSSAGTQPAASAIQLAPPANDADTGLRAQSRWKWASLGIGVLWLATVAAWLLTHRKRRESQRAPEETPGVPGKSAARAAFLSACASDDAYTARRSLLAWANSLTPKERIPGLSALAKAIGDPAVADMLRALDRACYAGETWHGAPLAEALKKWPMPAGKPAVVEPKLAPLYR